MDSVARSLADSKVCKRSGLVMHSLAVKERALCLGGLSRSDRPLQFSRKRYRA